SRRVMIETPGAPRLASLRPLFPADIPNASILHGVLSGGNTGRVILDDFERPSWCVVKPVHYGFTFVGGRVAPADLAEAIEWLRRDGDVSLVAQDGESWESIGAPRPDGEVARWEFSGRAAAADELARRVPEG